MFGNKPFFDFVKQYGIQQTTIHKKYNTIAAKYYRDRLNYEVLGGLTSDFITQQIPPIATGKLTKKELKQ